MIFYVFSPVLIIVAVFLCTFRFRVTLPFCYAVLNGCVVRNNYCLSHYTCSALSSRFTFSLSPICILHFMSYLVNVVCSHLSVYIAIEFSRRIYSWKITPHFFITTLKEAVTCDSKNWTLILRGRREWNEHVEEKICWYEWWEAEHWLEEEVPETPPRRKSRKAELNLTRNTNDVDMSGIQSRDTNRKN